MPLIALGAGVATLTIGLARRDTPPQALTVIAAAGSFAALAFIFTSPVIAAVILIEATGLGGPKLRVVLIPGLLAAGIGTLVSIGIGSFTGLNTSAYALGPIPLAALARPTAPQFGWTIVLAILVAVVTRILMRGGIFTHGFVSRTQLRLFVMLPVIGLIIAGLAIGFSQASGKSVNYVLFDGQDQLPGLVMNAGAWSLGAVELLIACKGLAYGLSLGAFRGGPPFPAIFLGAAGESWPHTYPGSPRQQRSRSGPAPPSPPSSGCLSPPSCSRHCSPSTPAPELSPLIIVGVVVSYVVTLLLSRRSGRASPRPDHARTPHRARNLNANRPRSHSQLACRRVEQRTGFDARAPSGRSAGGLSSVVVTVLVHDEHGARGALQNALRRAAFQPRAKPVEAARADHDRRRIVFAGDLQDRGGDIAAVRHRKRLGVQAQRLREFGSLAGYAVSAATELMIHIEHGGGIHGRRHRHIRRRGDHRVSQGPFPHREHERSARLGEPGGISHRLTCGGRTVESDENWTLGRAHGDSICERSPDSRVSRVERSA
jgi:hypothetical protein